VVTDHLHVADIADGYDVVVLGADKWAQVLDAAFYASEAKRDAAVARLPRLAVVPRNGLPLPEEGVVLDLDDELAAVSSTAARAVDVPGQRPALAVGDVRRGGDAANRRRHVDVLDQRVDDAGTAAAGWAQDQRHPDRRLVEDALRHQAVVPAHLPVVARVDDP